MAYDNDDEVYGGSNINKVYNKKSGIMVKRGRYEEGSKGTA